MAITSRKAIKILTKLTVSRKRKYTQKFRWHSPRSQNSSAVWDFAVCAQCGGWCATFVRNGRCAHRFSDTCVGCRVCCKLCWEPPQSPDSKASGNLYRRFGSRAGWLWKGLQIACRWRRGRQGSDEVILVRVFASFGMTERTTTVVCCGSAVGKCSGRRERREVGFVG